MMNYLEASGNASRKELERYASGIAKMNALAQSLVESGDIPLKFSPEPIHPSLEGKVTQEALTHGGKSGQELLAMLSQKGFRIENFTREFMQSSVFVTEPRPRRTDLVRTKLINLGFGNDYISTRGIFNKMAELDLAFCPPEIGPSYALQFKNMKKGGDITFIMKADGDMDKLGGFHIFQLRRGLGEEIISANWCHAEVMWSVNQEVVFKLKEQGDN